MFSPDNPLGEFSPREQAESDARFLNDFFTALEGSGPMPDPGLTRAQRIIAGPGGRMMVTRFEALAKEVKRLREFEIKWNAAMELMGAIGKVK